MRARRLLAIALVVLLLAPGTWVRTGIPAARNSNIAITPVVAARPASWPEGLSLEAAWRLVGADMFFGGYSALVPAPEGRMRAFSDRGDRLTFTLPGHGPPEAELATVPAHPRFAHATQDIEAAAHDPDAEGYWLGYEAINAIRRFGPGEESGAIVAPPAMDSWPPNGGAEAMVRLEEGAMLVLSEREGEALKFAGDPVAGADSFVFHIEPPKGYRPTDAAQLPDGRVLVLMRRLELALPPRFHTLIAIGDPHRIEQGETWPLEIWARLEDPVPPENYEGLAVVPRTDGSQDIWVISDDNLDAFQRTLLLHLRFTPPD